ncbi:hypothetical protein LPJ66_004110 [Kickxella alabastrina]|uniref:Uncharacterized protein n=1 Tax=Kickxella alabastrina TaxID=61397 RepID=A0ACC1II65_9FUNG|nr:hypothetical protein LPJ66_004110 [Kickxella alabastrina]
MRSGETDGFTLVTAKYKRGRAVHKTPAPQPTTSTTHTTSLYAATSTESTTSTTTVLSKKNRRTKPIHQHQDVTQSANTAAIDSLISKINSKRYTIRTSGYLTSLQPHLDILLEHNPDEIICYGLGSPLASPVSQWQLALILELNHGLGTLPILAFDPATTSQDHIALGKLNVSLISINEEAQRAVSCRTLFYMPHCEQFLYENLVRANWSKERIPQLIILGNRFARYREAQGLEEFKKRSVFLDLFLECLDTVVELPGESGLRVRHCPYAFTDTCLQRVDRNKLVSIDFGNEKDEDEGENQPELGFEKNDSSKTKTC